jgi:YD repeat-containing protein
VHASAVSVTYHYDALNRLTGVGVNAGQQTAQYTYDAAGNRLSRQVGVAERQSPVLTITGPVNDAVVTAAALTISGTASDSTTGASGIASITVNALAATGDTASGTGTANWSFVAPLAPGSNDFTVIATDASPYANQTTQKLTVVYLPPIVDTSGDGIPDSWESAHGLDPAVNNASGDADGDGYTNLQEYLAGTDPQDPNSHPAGAKGIDYVPFQDKFNQSRYQDRWYLGALDPDTVYSLTESATGLHGTVQRPATGCQGLRLLSFGTIDATSTVFEGTLQVNGYGSTALGLMSGTDTHNRIEVRFTDTAPYLLLRSWSGGTLTEVPATVPTDYRGGKVSVRLVKTDLVVGGGTYSATTAYGHYYLYVNHVLQGEVVNTGIGDHTLRPYLELQSCASDPGYVDTTFTGAALLLDRDGDGLADRYEDQNLNGVVDAGESDPLNPDTDGDGVPDGFDNCTLVANPRQRDTDHDGYGNRCDADFDNNGIVNFADLAYIKAHFGTSDPNADLDGNGIVNFADLAITKSLFGKPPGPSGIVP